MAGGALPLLLLLGFSAVAFGSDLDPCSAATPLAGSRHDLPMLQHQLRGRLTVVNACSFSVESFDMLPASPSARWWGAHSPSLHDLSAGFPVADLPLNRTFSNQSLTVRLLPNLSLPQIPVLAVWDPSTASDLGHVLLSDDFHLQPTTLRNCKVLAPNYRLRWTLHAANRSIEIALEAAVGSQYYMAFGWSGGSHPSAAPPMLHSDVVVAGFADDGLTPFAEDYFISGYNECSVDADGKARGVCPDVMYADGSSAVNNTELVYGHRRDGVSFVRYRRLLSTGDGSYDVAVNELEKMTVIWALGKVRPPDSFSSHYLPQNHGGLRSQSYGFLSLNVSEIWDDCLGPLDAAEKQDQDLVFADGKSTLTVTTGPPVRFPDLPAPPAVFYINGKEAPVLHVERGVPVRFFVQAGPDVGFYITSDPIGGNATRRNASEVVYAVGQGSELLWRPSLSTPDLVYYQSLHETKMGWRIQVVDGGLQDLYNNSVLLDGQLVNFFWTLSEGSISIAARSERKSGYLAIGFGREMVHSFVYVGWMDSVGKGQVRSYWIDGRDASMIHPTDEDLTDAKCTMQNGFLTMEFTRKLSPSCKGRMECKNVIDPETPLRVIWAVGSSWTGGSLTWKNMHSATSGKPVRVFLLRGSAEAEQDLRPVLAVHGFMMFVAWGVLLPGGILAARYLKHLKGNGWFRLHVYLQYSGIAIMMLGFLFAAAELRGIYTSSLHVKFGLTAVVLACAQPLNACIRPKKPGIGEATSQKRVIWEYFHVITGRFAVVTGVAALISGLKHLEEGYGGENVHELDWALVAWFVIVATMVVYLEYLEARRKRSRSSFRGRWVLGNEEDDSTDLIPSDNRSEQKHTFTRSEVQLEPLS